ncbi:MAG: hypothetical protein NVS2B8_20770 [Vulcanimicrobiaceae bacterium]
MNAGRTHREMKIVAIVFGSLVALLAIAAFAVLVLGSRVANGIVAERPDDVRRIAARVATFAVPRDYHIERATDVGVQQTVTLVRNGHERGGFTMLLQRSAATIDSRSAAKSMAFALGLAARVVGCIPHASTDRIALPKRTIDFSSIACDGGTHALHVETGVVPERVGSLTIVATGFDDVFDREALVALLRSLR